MWRRLWSVFGGNMPGKTGVDVTGQEVGSLRVRLAVSETDAVLASEAIAAFSGAERSQRDVMQYGLDWLTG